MSNDDEREANDACAEDEMRLLEVPAHLIMDALPDASSNNWYVFQFLKQRARFVASHQGFEAFVVWGPIVDTVAQIHALRVRAKRGDVGGDFRSALVALSKSVDLSIVAIPLLVNELRRIAKSDPSAANFLTTSTTLRTCEAQIRSRQVWNAREDVAQTPTLLSDAGHLSASQNVREVIDTCRYANVLYKQYRCPLVHGLEFGAATWAGDLNCEAPATAPKLPKYMNWSYPDGDDRPEKLKYPVRIAFDQRLLASILHEVIQHEEDECSRQGWQVPAYATK